MRSRSVFSAALMLTLMISTLSVANADALQEDSPASSLPSSRLELHLRASYRTFVPTVPATPAHHEGSALFGVTFYQTRVVDDENALGLQPFLQRASTIQVRGHFLGGADFLGEVGNRRLFQSNLQFGAQLATDTYVTPFFAIGGSVGFERTQLRSHEQTMSESVAWYSIPVAMNFGVRFGDIRIDAQYRLRAFILDTASAVDGWGTLSLSGRAVVRRFVSLELSAALQRDSVRGGVGVELYPTRKLELGASIGYSRNLLGFSEPGSLNTLSGTGHISYWFYRALGLSMDYAVAGFLAGTGQATHLISLGLTSRF